MKGHVGTTGVTSGGFTGCCWVGSCWGPGAGVGAGVGLGVGAGVGPGVGVGVGEFMQYQTAQSIPEFAEGAGEAAAASPAARWAWARALPSGQVLARQHRQGLGTGIATAAPGQRRAAAGAGHDGLIEKLGDLKAKGILTEEEFQAKKTELLKKL